MHRRILAAIVVMAAAARFWGLSFGLPHTYARPDETIIMDVALSFLKGNLRPTFYDYPWLFMWTLAGLFLLYYVGGQISGLFHSVAEMIASWRVNWVPFFLISRGFSALIGTATVLVVYHIARRFWDETTALVAALFMALAFLHVRDSHFATTDVTMTFLIVLSVSFLVEGHLSKRRRDFVIAGLIGGLAAATKYNALVLAAPLLVSYLVNLYDQPDRRRGVRDRRLFEYGLPFLATFALGVPFLFFDLPKVIQEMMLLQASMLTGVRGAGRTIGWLHHLQFSLGYGIGFPLLAAGIAGFALVLVLQPSRGLVLLSFPIAYFIVAGSIRNVFFRYAIPVVPFLCLAAARLVTCIAAKLPKPARFPEAVTAGLALALVLPTAVSTVRFDRLASRTDNRVVVARWFDEHVPSGSSVLMSGSPYGYVQFTRAKNYEAWVWDRDRLMFVTDLNRRPTIGRPEYILLQESPLPYETQQQVKDFLAEHYDLVERFPAFTPDGSHIYDWQDAFFMPFAGFAGVERPGPNYTLYKRSGDGT